jgi:hypothetical protein
MKVKVKIKNEGKDRASLSVSLGRLLSPHPSLLILSSTIRPVLRPPSLVQSTADRYETSEGGGKTRERREKQLRMKGKVKIKNEGKNRASLSVSLGRLLRTSF